jgi:signal transduction histidine kinase
MKTLREQSGDYSSPKERVGGLGIILSSTDLSETKEIELELSSLETKPTATEKRLDYCLRFEELLSNISMRFINLAPDQVDQGIRDALAKIAQFAEVEVSYVFLFKDNNQRADITHWWIDGGRKPQFRLQDVSVEKYAAVMNQILQGKVCDIPSSAKLPETAPAVKRFMSRQGLRSASIVPLMYGGKTIGLVGFASPRVRPQYDDKMISLLRMVGQILASAVQLKRSQEELKNIERQVLQAHKLDSLSLLAGGIARDFSKILTGILRDIDEVKKIRPSALLGSAQLSQIEAAAKTAIDLTKRLQAYSGKVDCEFEAVDISLIANDLVQAWERKLAENQRLECNFADDLPPIKGDSGQLSQLLHGLITNAAEAVGDKDGVITLSTGLMSLDRDGLMKAYLNNDLDEGVYVYLRVADTGCGMDKQTALRIFDPFFSTKEQGRGVGLASALGIVRAHGGAMRVDSLPGKGAVFTVFFPCPKTL